MFYEKTGLDHSLLLKLTNAHKYSKGKPADKTELSGIPVCTQTNH